MFYVVIDDRKIIRCGYVKIYNQAAMRAEAVLELLNKIRCTISTCWGDVEFCGNIWQVCEFLIQ